jgi:hypothetical protein
MPPPNPFKECLRVLAEESNKEELPILVVCRSKPLRVENR